MTPQVFRSNRKSFSIARVQTATNIIYTERTKFRNVNFVIFIFMISRYCEFVARSTGIYVQRESEKSKFQKLKKKTPYPLRIEGEKLRSRPRQLSFFKCVRTRVFTIKFLKYLHIFIKMYSYRFIKSDE